MAGARAQKVMTQPINLIFRFLQNKARVQVWLYGQANMRIEGRIVGFDEFMNLVLDEAEEVNVKQKTRRTLGRIMLKGDNVTLIMGVSKGKAAAGAAASEAAGSTSAPPAST
ncbi:Small nuclear ribonucleoprotein E [Hondaea fermentalgiana]|uniref:Small nuclear ribonucleoprotein E n=1 Tax=Hondaea fermentalgiana TaxID=2315210 RepID=A0A2R5GDM5_9STRA|nr:Small nuclear ribonucleoprotein E [Hondaea fermentalgiana]|eukprot:GBG28665.1 Small nuclear ribonucleoprotein E [Hondaea fermentalgiana]